MIEFREVTFAYPTARPVFDRFNWSIARGEAWAVIGASGGGKTTLLMLLAGLRQPTGGSITIDGQSVDRPRPQTGLVLQEYGLLPWATVAQNAALGLRVRDYYGPDGRHAPVEYVMGPIAQRVDPWLKRWASMRSATSSRRRFRAGSVNARRLRARWSLSRTCC